MGVTEPYNGPSPIGGTGPYSIGFWQPGGSTGSGGGSSYSGSFSTSGGGAIPIAQTIYSSAPIAAFIFTVYANGVVAFVNKSIGSISSYIWNFGDGKHSTSPSVVHQYVGSGTFTVTLTVANASGRSSYSLSVTIAAVPVPATVDFTYVVSGLDVQVTDTSSAPGPRLWYFGDSVPQAEAVNPFHIYSTSGIYDVTLTIGSVSVTKKVTIDRGIILSWTDNANNETGFKIEHSLNGTDWTQIGTTGANITSFLVTKNANNIDPAVVNYFRVRATDGSQDSGYTNVITVQCS